MHRFRSFSSRRLRSKRIVYRYREALLKKYQSSLPALSKPTFSEQQQHVNRLYQSSQSKPIKELSLLLKQQERGKMSKSDGIQASEYSQSQKFTF